MENGLHCQCCHQTEYPMVEMSLDQLSAFETLLDIEIGGMNKIICGRCSELLSDSLRFCQQQQSLCNPNMCAVCQEFGKPVADLVKLETMYDPKLQEVFDHHYGYLSANRKICLECMMRFEKIHDFFQKCYHSFCSPIVHIQDVKQEEEEIIDDLVLDEDDGINPMAARDRGAQKPDIYTRYHCGKCSESFKYRKYFLEHMAKHQGEQQVHKCEFCGETFVNQLDFDKHSSLHQLDNIHRKLQKASVEFACPECGRAFLWGMDVELHLYHAHNQMIGKEKTDFTFLPYPEGVEERLKQIRFNENVPHPYECLQCGTKFKERKNLKQHLLSVHSKSRPFACPQCPCAYKSKGSLMHHFKKHANESTKEAITHEVFGTEARDFPCRHCPKQYTSYRTRQQHEYHCHHNRRYFLCRFCDKQFVQKRSLWEHAFTHRDSFAYNCLECDYQANQKLNFIKHLRKAHNQQFNPIVHEYTKETYEQVIDFVLLTRKRIEDIDPCETRIKTVDFCCNKCTQTFANADDLKTHQSIHDRHFQCHFCSAIYYHRRFIESHLAKHLSNSTVKTVKPKGPKIRRPRVNKYGNCEPIQIEDPKNKVSPFLLYPCPSCSKQFRSKISVNRHISQAHGTLGPKFKCLVCSKFYPSPKSLKRHLETVHISVKEFQCEICLSFYKTQQSLTIHMRLHETADNCFACEQCTKTFQSQTGLTKHIKISHNHEVEVCPICFKTFVTADGLFEHSFTHKGFDPFSCPKPDCSYTVKGKECFANHLITHHGLVYDEKIYGFKPDDEEGHRSAYLEKLKLQKSKRKYECHFCEDKRFPTKLNLLYHMMSYKHIKTLICRLCDKKYIHEYMLIRHSYSHSGDKDLPFKCQQCSYSTACQRRYRIHLKSKHEITFNNETHGLSNAKKQQILASILKN